MGIKLNKNKNECDIKVLLDMEVKKHKHSFHPVSQNYFFLSIKILFGYLLCVAKKN